MTDGAGPGTTVCPRCQRPNPRHRSTCWGCGATLGPVPKGGPVNAPPAPAARGTGSVLGTAKASLPGGAAPVDDWPFPPEGRADVPDRVERPHTGRRSGRRSWKTVGMAVAAAALVLAVVFAVVVGFLPTAAGPGITYADPMPFSQFIAQAESVAHSAEDGPWTPVAVLGLGESVSAAGTAAGAVLGAANCTDVWAASGTYTLPATPSNAPTGEVSAWFVFSTDTTYRALLTMVTNVSGTVQAANLEIVPQSCISGFSSYQPLPAATSVVDSTTVATAADGQGGSAFLSSHPQATSEFLVSNFSGNVTWTVLYTTCTFISGGTETGETFVASLNATTGAVFTAGAETMSCS